jgi:hypothetical protein
VLIAGFDILLLTFSVTNVYMSRREIRFRLFDIAIFPGGPGDLPQMRRPPAYRLPRGMNCRAGAPFAEPLFGVLRRNMGGNRR